MLEGKCIVDNCHNYSDVDLYYENGETRSMCSAHALGIRFAPAVAQMVRNMVGHRTNVFLGFELNDTTVEVAFKCKIIGPCFNHKHELVGYHAEMRVSKNRKIRTVIKRSQILVPFGDTEYRKND